MEIKKCIKCGIEKSIDDFEFRKDKNTYRNICKDCKRKSDRERYELNKDKINEARRKKYNENKDEINKKRREIYSQIKDEYNAKRKLRKNSDPIKKLKTQVYNAIVKSYERKGFTRTKSVEEIIGRSLDEYVEQLLKTYKYEYKKDYDGTEKIHVDHIIPIWTAETVEELDGYNKCLQLLLAAENKRKGGKVANGRYKNGKIKYTYYNPHWFDE